MTEGEGWPSARIQDLCVDVNVGFVGPSSEVRSPTGVPFLMGKNIGPGYLRLEGLERVDPAFHDSQRKSQLVAGDVVVVRIGESGQAARIPPSLGQANCAGLVIIKQPRGIDGDFLTLYLNSAEGRETSIARSAGTTRQTLNTQTVANMVVPLPPEAVQRRIVDLMAHLDQHLAHLRLELLVAERDLREGRAEAMRVGTFARAGDAFDILMGRQRSPSRASGPNMTPYLRAANVKDGRLDLTDVKEMDFNTEERVRFGLRRGDVLVSEGSGSADAVGAAARWREEIGGPLCFQNTLLRFRSRQGTTIPDFVYQWCRWAYESGAFRETASGTNILHIGSTRAVEMPVRIPNLRDQEALCQVLEARESVCVSLGMEIESLQTVRAQTLDALLSGASSIPEEYDQLSSEAV